MVSPHAPAVGSEDPTYDSRDVVQWRAMCDDDGNHQPDSPQGRLVDASDPQVLRAAIGLAFDYRGDVTIKLKSTGQTIEGYVFDRGSKTASGDDAIRVLPTDGSPRTTLRCDDIAELRFSGRDTAAGKSFDTWMKKYVRTKLSGGAANIEPEVLE